MKQQARTSTANSVLRKIEAGFASLAAPPGSAEVALSNIDRWLDAASFEPYQPQLLWLIESEQWKVLLDSFYRVLPFGTGGRRGPVGIGTNRFNPVTLSSSVQGHVDYLRERFPGEQLAVAIAYDVREFRDLRRVYNPDLANPLIGMTSRAFAHLAAGVYAANDVHVRILPSDSTTYVSTPELSFIIRRLKLSGGLNISASHNHPDDNGGKVFGHHGGQEVPPHDQEMAERVEKVAAVRSLSLSEGVEKGMIHWIAPELHQQYIDLNLAQSLDPAARSSRIVFTPLHGTGDTTTGEVLRRAGFSVQVVAEQASPDGSFPTVPFRAPNPEVPESMAAGIQLARASGADIVLACDPDADRIGCCSIATNGGYRFLTGNEIACIVTHFKLDTLRRQNRLPRNPLVITTEVTTGLIRAITEDFGGTVIGDLLVGFKYHADVLRQLEASGRFKNVTATLSDFVVANEESHGVLVTPELRDKDAAGAAMLLAEAAALQRARGLTLVDYLNDIYLRYGYHANVLVSMVMGGAEGVRDIDKIQSVLRQSPPVRIADWKVVEMVDHQDPNGVHGPILSDTDRAARNLLVFKLENGARVIIRPSGTEPKNKTYIEVPSAPLGAAADRKTLGLRKAEVAAVAQRIADDFTRQMLAVIGVELPAYALRISGLVPLEKRIAFARDFVPALEKRVSALCRGQSSQEQLSKWIDASLRSYGEDARGLVAAAIHAYVETERSNVAPIDYEQRERFDCLDKLAEFFPGRREVEL